MADEDRTRAIAAYTAALRASREIEARATAKREQLREARRKYDQSESDITALQSVGQEIGEVLRQLDEDRFIIKKSSGPRHVVGVRRKLDKAKLVSGTRVTLDITTLTIMRQLPREIDPSVYQMLSEDPGSVSFSSVGGLQDQIRELREVRARAAAAPAARGPPGPAGPAGILRAPTRPPSSYAPPPPPPFAPFPPRARFSPSPGHARTAGCPPPSL